MNSVGVCSECGTAIPADSPGGFCSRCLLGLGLIQMQSAECRVRNEEELVLSTRMLDVFASLAPAHDNPMVSEIARRQSYPQ